MFEKFKRKPALTKASQNYLDMSTDDLKKLFLKEHRALWKCGTNAANGSTALTTTQKKHFSSIKLIAQQLESRGVIKVSENHTVDYVPRAHQLGRKLKSGQKSLSELPVDRKLMAGSLEQRQDLFIAAYRALWIASGYKSERFVSSSAEAGYEVHQIQEILRTVSKSLKDDGVPTYI